MGKARRKAIEVPCMKLKYPTILQTPKGNKDGNADDYLLEDPDGDQYIVPNHTFHKLYDIVDEENEKIRPDEHLPSMWAENSSE